MKKRYALLLTGLLTLSLAAGCGAKTDNAGETSAPAVSESQAAESTEQTADESGAAYEFSFETAPEGLENVAGGDTVKVTYTGEISEVDPFNGTVISVEKQ